MTFGMEFHDSWLLEARCESDGSGYALFNGVVYRSEGMVFDDAQESGWQKVRFLFEGMSVEGEFIKFGDYAAKGNLWIDGKHGNGTTLLPADHVGTICLELCLSPEFNTVKIHASQVSSKFEGDFAIEGIWDADGNVTRA